MDASLILEIKSSEEQAITTQCMTKKLAQRFVAGQGLTGLRRGFSHSDSI